MEEVEVAEEEVAVALALELESDALALDPGTSVELYAVEAASALELVGT